MTDDPFNTPHEGDRYLWQPGDVIVREAKDTAASMTPPPPPNASTIR